MLDSMRFFRAAMATAIIALGVCAPAIAEGPETDETGWTPWTLAPGARVIYASSSTGSDSNSGLSMAAPVRSLAKAYSLLRDGNPDWVLLKSGDVWNESFPNFTKSANSMTQYMMIGAYGSGPRPQLRVTSPAFYGGGQTVRRGLAIVDLDLAPAVPGSQYAGITFLESWGHILIEGCLVSGFPTNIVFQETGPGRLPDIQVRRCVIVDSHETGSGHSQGLFMGSCDNWLVEDCVFDSNARNKADMFCHNAYIHETNGPGIFRGNISARACSHGVQQRPGGTMENCLFLQNPVNAYQGKSATDHPAAVNYFRNNVALDSRDINSTDVRGFGFVVGAADTTIVEYNVAAHQRSGTANTIAFNFDHLNAATIRGNVVYDWTYNGAGWGAAYEYDGAGSGAVLFENNKAYQPFHGMCVRHEARALDSSFTYRNNQYYSTNPWGGYQPFASVVSVGGDWNWWKARAGEPGSTFANPGQFNATIDAYQLSIGISGSVPEFMAQARMQSKLNWRSQYSAPVVNAWVRGKFGVAGSGPACYANCDGSTTPPVLNVVDMQCFLNRFASANIDANCDGSTAAPILNVNDFICFMNKFAAGCP